LYFMALYLGQLYYFCLVLYYLLLQLFCFRWLIWFEIEI